MEFTTLNTFTPRHMRKKFRKKGGPPDIEKSRAFRRAAALSKQFITQSASFLSRNSIMPRYEAYKAKCGDGTRGLRTGGGGG